MKGPRHFFENQLVGRKPLCSVMLKKPQIARNDRAENAVHRDVERRIIVSDAAERLFCAHFRQKLFFDFSDDAVFGSRAGWRTLLFGAFLGSCGVLQLCSR